MHDLIGYILWSSIKNLFDNQPDIFTFTYETGETEWNLGHHLANEIHKYLFWLDHDLDLTKRNYENKRPDIIFHKRGIHALNFLVVELKHRGADISYDIQRIEDYWMGDRLDYRFGASIIINDMDNYKVKVFEGHNIKLYNKDSNCTPIEKIPKSKVKPYSRLVDKILTLAKDGDYHNNPNKQAKVKEYERQIDQMIYKLYRVTPEEIETVENS